MSTSHHTFDIPPVHDCRAVISVCGSNTCMMMRTPRPHPTSHIRTAQEQVTVEFRIEITQGGMCHVCRCAAAAHGIRQEYCARSSPCFTQPSYIPPRLKYGIAGHFWLRRRHPCASVYGAVGFRTVHEVSDNNVSHSHRGSIAVKLSGCHSHTGPSAWQYCNLVWFSSHGVLAVSTHNHNYGTIYHSFSYLCGVGIRTAVATSFNNQSLHKSFQGLGTTSCQAVTTFPLSNLDGILLPSEPPTQPASPRMPRKFNSHPTSAGAPFCTERRRIRRPRLVRTKTQGLVMASYARNGHWNFSECRLDFEAARTLFCAPHKETVVRLCLLYSTLILGESYAFLLASAGGGEAGPPLPPSLDESRIGREPASCCSCARSLSFNPVRCPTTATAGN